MDITTWIVSFFVIFLRYLCIAVNVSSGRRTLNDTSHAAANEILVTKAASTLTCYTACANNPDCNSIYFDETTSTCRHFGRVFPETNDMSEFEQTQRQYFYRFIPHDCGDWYKVKPHSGVYTTYTSGSQKMNVLCDMDTDGGGWTVIQRRQDGSIDFNKGWDSYKYGFGNLYSEFWLGNENIHTILLNGNYTLRVDLEDFEGNTRFAQYTTFNVGSESSLYILSIGGYSGDAGDSFPYHQGQKFTTNDRDNDLNSGNCAVDFGGGWWFNKCHNCHLNGRYLVGVHGLQLGSGINWLGWRGHGYSLKSSKMMIRKTI